jgi:hypothetical protein
MNQDEAEAEGDQNLEGQDDIDVSVWAGRTVEKEISAYILCER